MSNTYTDSEVIQEMLRNNASKQSISLRSLKDRLNEVKQTNYQQPYVNELIKQLSYEINKASVTNPFYYQQKSQQKHSSKTKQQVIQVTQPALSADDKYIAYDSAITIIAYLDRPDTSDLEASQYYPAEEEKELVQEEQHADILQFYLVEEQYQLMYGDSAKEFMDRDVELVQSSTVKCSVGKSPRINRIRMLILDPEMSTPELKSNVSLYILYYSLYMLKTFATPRDKARQIYLWWLYKLLKYTDITYNPQVYGIIDLLKTV